MASRPSSLTARPIPSNRWCTRRDWDRHEAAARSTRSQATMEDIVAIRMGYGNKNSVLSQRLDSSLLVSAVLRY